MLHQIFRQQMRFLRQRIRSPHIAFFQCRTNTLHIASDLPHRLLLFCVQGASRQPFQFVVGRAQQLFRVVTLAGGFRGSHPGRDLRSGLTRSALAHHNLVWSTIRRRRGAFSASSASGRRTGNRFFLRRALRRCLPRGWRLRIGGRSWPGLCRNLLCRRVLRLPLLSRRRRLFRGRVLCWSRGWTRSLSCSIRGAGGVVLPRSPSPSRGT
jgi:hypothetical protein